MTYTLMKIDYDVTGVVWAKLIELYAQDLGGCLNDAARAIRFCCYMGSKHFFSVDMAQKLKV